jgi:class 3 adenylate cyclase
VDPIYEVPDPTADAAFNLVATGVLVLAVLAYFAHQRDRFQRRSDHLLHNILPNEIADRLKDGRAMIADDFAAASVLFADVVNFTPMSAGMAPAELVGLLNDVFTSFDELVAALGLEKIKTVGDEYMVAAGVPRPAPTTRTPSPSWRSGSATTSRRARSPAVASRCGSASTPAR